MRARSPLDVPFRSQREIPTARWAERGCAIACAGMVLGYYGCPVPLTDVLAAALARTAFAEYRGWLHSGLVGALHDLGLAAYRRNWRLLDGHEQQYLAGRSLDAPSRDELAAVKQQMLEEGLRTMARLLRGGIPVIASVYRPWGDRSSIGHQIVLLGLTADELVYHDPADLDGAFRRHPADDFAASWKGLAIVAPGRLSPNTG
jgi:Peptidase_C39 like family